MSQIYYNSWNFMTLSAVAFSPDGITQDDLIVLTGGSRTRISSTLSFLRSTGLIKIIKIPLIRKKYYQLNIPLNDIYRSFFGYLQKKYEENTSFIEKVLSSLQSLKNSSEILELSHFKNFLEDFIKINSLGIYFSRKFKNRSLNFPKLNSDLQSKYMKKLSVVAKATISQTSHNSPFSPSSKPSHELDTIKQSYFQQLRALYEKIDRKGLYIALIHVISIEVDAPTQERLMTLTNLPRSTLSEALSKIEADGLIKSVKNTNIGKLCYFLCIPIQLIWIISRYQLLQLFYELIEFFTKISNKISQDTSDSELVRYINMALNELDQYINYVLFLIKRISDEFKLHLL